MLQRNVQWYVSFTGEVGNAAKMMLIVNMVQGSFMATIAEGLTLAQVTGQSQQTLLDILNQGQLASIFLDQKCQSKFPSCFVIGHGYCFNLAAVGRDEGGKVNVPFAISLWCWELSLAVPFMSHLM